MLAFLLCACSSPDDTGDPAVTCAFTTLDYVDVAAAWGLVDTTDAETFPNTGGGVTVAMRF